MTSKLSAGILNERLVEFTTKHDTLLPLSPPQHIINLHPVLCSFPLVGNQPRKLHDIAQNFLQNALTSVCAEHAHAWGARQSNGKPAASQRQAIGKSVAISGN
jgi:hypothetical protein